LSAGRRKEVSVMRMLEIIACVAVALTAAAFGGAAAQAPSEKQIAERIAKDYGVTVLKTTKGEEDGRPVLFVTVMNDGGNDNAAFQVSTLAVDPATGDLISQYRTTPTGRSLSGAATRTPSSDESGAALRQWSTRHGPR
jgi:hypothetical protein